MKKTLLLAAVALVGLLLALWITLWAVLGGDRLHARARRAWAEQAITSIGTRLADAAWLTNELARVARNVATHPGEEGHWLSEDLILARNGDWLACACICSKEEWRVHDLFVGRASDGQWYFSTYHFCKGKVVLRAEEQPQSLSEFVEAYCLRPFDATPDACLDSTWPPPRD